MALVLTCETYVGRRLLVEPHFGYGWNAQVTSPYPDVQVPAEFHFVPQRFFRFEGRLMGGIGTIGEHGHPLDGLLLGFAARHTLDRDFVADPVICNLTIGCEERVAENGWLLAVGPPNIVGFGRLRDDTV